MKIITKILLISTFYLSLLPSDLYSQWIQQGIPTNEVVQDMHFLDSLNGWLVCSNGAVLDSGIILRTTDGGESWIKQYGADSTPLLAIRMADLNTGYCVGWFRKVLKTTDGGLNWLTLPMTMGIFFNDVEVLNKDTFYISDRSDSPALYKTTNGGINFSGIYSALGGQEIFFIDSYIGWAGVNGSRLIKTTNGGQNWTTLRDFPNPIGDIFFVNQNTGWLIGGEGTGILKTTNGGVNFVQQSLPPNSNTQFGIFMRNPDYGWLCGSFNQIFKTYNGGATWIKDSIPIFSCQNVWFVDSLKGWCSGAPGIAKTTTGGGPTTIISINNEIPNAFILKQNYPNPFNPTTTIEFQINKSFYIDLIIYDMLGRSIELYRNHQLQPGTYKAVYDASDLSSGVYYYKLNVKNNNGGVIHTDTKKMILIK